MHLYMQHYAAYETNNWQVPKVSSPFKKFLVLTVSFSSVQGRSRMFQYVVCLVKWPCFGHLQHSPACVWSVGNVRFSHLRVRDPSCSQTSSCTHAICKTRADDAGQTMKSNEITGCFLNDFGQKWRHTVITSCHVVPRASTHQGSSRSGVQLIEAHWGEVFKCFQPSSYHLPQRESQ